MPAYGYEFYLLVVNSISHECSERVRYRVDHSKIKFISTRGHVISSIYENVFRSANIFIFMQIKLIFIRNFLHQDSF